MLISSVKWLTITTLTRPVPTPSYLLKALDTWPFGWRQFGKTGRVPTGMSIFWDGHLLGCPEWLLALATPQIFGGDLLKWHGEMAGGPVLY